MLSPEFKWDGYEDATTRNYRIKYNADGTLPSDGSADLGWTENKAARVHMGKKDGNLLNEKLDKAKLESIYHDD